MKNRNIDLYLRTAFRELDRFSIPDIGTFRKIYRSASVSSDMEKVQPPLEAVEFEERYYDSLNLSGYLQNNVGFPDGESQQIVLAIRNAMLEEFGKKQRFEIPDIGVLRQEENGKLVFMPAELEKNLFSTDFFGLKPVPLPGAPSNVVAMEHQDNLGPMTKTESRKQKTLAGSIGWKPILVVVLFVGLGALLITNGPFITGSSEQAARNAADSGAMALGPVASPNPADSATGAAPLAATPPALAGQDSTAPQAALPPDSSAAKALTASEPATVDSNAQKQPEALLADGATPTDEAREMTGVSRGLAAPVPTDIGVLDTVKRNARITRSEPAQPAVQPSAERKAPEARTSAQTEIEAYHLVVGSFSSSQAAVTLVKKIEAEGMRATILFPPAGSTQSYRVSVFSAKDKEQVAAYNQILKNLGKQTGWVFAKPK